MQALNLYFQAEYHYSTGQSHFLIDISYPYFKYLTDRVKIIGYVSEMQHKSIVPVNTNMMALGLLNLVHDQTIKFKAQVN